MESIRFTDAIMKDCILSNELDLSKTIFPSDNNHLMIKKDRIKVFEKARDIIASFWEGEERSRALTLIDTEYLNTQKTDKDIEIIYNKSLDDINFSNHFFEVVKGVYQSIIE